MSKNQLNQRSNLQSSSVAVNFYLNVRRFLLATILLDIPFQVDFNLFQRVENIGLGSLGALNISVTTISILILYSIWLLELMFKQAQLPARFLFRAGLPLFVYLTFNIVSLAAAQDIRLSSFKIFFLIEMFLLYIYIVGTIRTQKDVLFIVTVLMIGLVAEGLIIIYAKHIGQSITIIRGIEAHVFGYNARIGGTLGNPNVTAGYLSLLIAPTIGILMTRINRFYKSLALLAFSFGVIALILTYSRGGWIATILSLALLFCIAWYQGKFPLKSAIFIVTLASVCWVYFQEPIRARTQGDHYGSTKVRIHMMQRAFRIILDKPIFGVGTNNYSVFLKQYESVRRFPGIESNAVVHNKYLLVWAETGIGGLAAFIWFLLTTLHQGWQVWKFKDPFLSPLALGFTVAIIGQMVHMLVDIFHVRCLVQILWLSAGLIPAMHYIGNNDPTVRLECTIVRKSHIS